MLPSPWRLQVVSVRCSATATDLPGSLQTLVQAFQSVPDPMAVRRRQLPPAAARRRPSSCLLASSAYATPSLI